MNNIWQIVVAALGASGIFGLIYSSIINRTMNKIYKQQDNRESLRDDNMFLMMSRMDSIADMTHLMASKLHDAGIINGDLEELDRKYQELENQYDKNLKKLALDTLKK